MATKVRRAATVKATHVKKVKVHRAKTLKLKKVK